MMLEEFAARVEMKERNRKFALQMGDQERAWLAEAARSGSYFVPDISLAGARRAAVALVALLLGSP
jgi:hypothetical protein